MEPDGVIEVSSMAKYKHWHYIFGCNWIIEVLIHPCTVFPKIQSNWNEITDNFDDMNLKETLLRGIYAYGFEKPSAIQQRAIIPCIKGTDTFLFKLRIGL